MDSSRLRTGEIVAGIGGLALFVFLFFDWFGGGVQVSGSVLNGSARVEETGVSGWDALDDLPGFLIILSGFSGLALAYLAAAGERLNVPVRRGAATAFLGSLAVLLILWRMVAGSPSLKIGIFLGLAAAIAIAAGALMALREDGYEVLVPAAGASAKAAASPPATRAASAPAAKKAPAPSKSSSTRSKSSAAKKGSGSSRSSSSGTRKRASGAKAKK